LDFFLDLAVTGKVLGVGVGGRPDDWSAVLGTDDGFQPSEYELVLQYGLIDAYFERGSGEWLCHRVSILAGKLPEFGDDWVPGAVRERYGQFPDRVPFEAVVGHLVQAGLEIDRVLGGGEMSLDEFWVAGSGVRFLVVSEARADDLKDLRVGDVWWAGAFEGGWAPPEQSVPYQPT
jgi:hypothetical protein